MTRFNLIKSILAAALLAFSLPVLAAAQGSYDPWGRNRDRDNGQYGRYNDRYLRDSIHRLDRLAKDFERDLDRALDRSRQNGTRREDVLNSEARAFRNAVGDLKGSFGSGRDINRSADEARRVLSIADRLERVANRVNDGRIMSEWAQIRRELRVIGDAYGYRNNGRYGRDDDIYRRNPNSNDPWYRRIPGVRVP